MPGVTGKTQIDQATGTFLAESRYTLQERPGVIASSVRRERLPENKGASVNIPKYGTVTTYALTEGVDMAQAQQITDTLMTITPAEFGAQVILTDLMMMTVKDEFFRVAGRILGDSFDRQREQTFADDFDSFSISIGADGTVLNVGHVMAAHAGIKYGTALADGTAGRGGEPGPDPITSVLGYPQIHGLKKAMAGGIGAAGATQVVSNLDRGAWSESFNLAGTTVKGSVNLNKAADDTIKGGTFSKEATILVELGAGPGVEKERDASLRGWELNFVGRWARGEYNDAWGREMLGESVQPSS